RTCRSRGLVGRRARGLSCRSFGLSRRCRCGTGDYRRRVQARRPTESIGRLLRMAADRVTRDHADAEGDAMLGAWVDRLAELGEEFRTAQPFPLLVIDGFLEEGAADAILDEFPQIETMPRSNDYMFGEKREAPTLGDAGPAGKELYEFFLSDQF